MNVAIFGAGYVGLVTGTVLADIGHHVQLIEVSKDKVSRIMAGLSPIFEEGLESTLARVRAKDQLRATVDPAQGLQSAKVVFIAVGTPPGPHGEPELSQVEAAARAIGQHLIVGGQTVVVNKATVPIGSAHLVSIWIEEGFREKHPGERLPDFSVASNPEFLREGSAIFDTLYPDRIVLGSDEGWVLDT
ncbi:MAG: 3-hydroxyacyl-CoA dehydrogenase NAD-binding domain-containing protein, partial [Sulfobacillus sp.]